MLAVRTRRPFFRSRPSKWLLLAAAGVATITFTLPFVELGKVIELMLPHQHYLRSLSSFRRVMRLRWSWERVFFMVESDTTAPKALAEHKQQTGEAMTAEELSQTLSKLHEELSGNPELDENTLRSLRALLGEIQVAIDRAAVEAPQADDSLESSLPVGQRLQAVISEFEARHPRLTLSLSQIADRLAAMGI